MYLDFPTFHMFYRISCVVGVLLTLPCRCNGQVGCISYRCLANGDCVRISDPQFLYHCECNDGFRLDSNLDCVDIDECELSVCGQSTCTNYPGSYQCSSCRRRGHTLFGNRCSDVDECHFNVCGPTGTCTNYDNLYRCKCYSGYEHSDGKCFNIDECADANICGTSAAGQCVDMTGTYRCECNTGYTLRNNTCADTDECLTSDLCGPSSAGQCVNIPGTYNCNCSTGYKLEANGGCEDIDECLTSDLCGPLSTGQCVNLLGSYKCNCSTGYILNSDGNCTDIDECHLPYPCDTNAVCANFPGDYNCTCNTGFSGDGKTCTAVASPATSLAYSPGVIAGIAVGGLLVVLAITLILVFLITRRNRTKLKREDLPLSNLIIDQEPSYANVRMSDVNSTGNINAEATAAVEGEVNADAFEDLYSNNLVKERKKEKRDLTGNFSPEDDGVIYANEQPRCANGDSYDILWKDSASQQKPGPIASSEEETYNHLHQRSLALPTSVDDGTGTSLYNHLYSGGEVPHTQITSQAGAKTIEDNGDDEYSLAL